MKRRWGLLFLLLGLVGAAAQAQEQEWYKYYNDAEAAAKSGQWSVTVNNLVNFCLKKYPRPKRNTQIYSHFYIDYKPYILLVEAYFNLKKYEAAKEYLDQQLENIELKEFGRDPAYVAKYNGLKEKLNAAISAAQKVQPVGGPAKDPALEQTLAQADEALRRGDYAGAQKLYTQVREAKGDPEASRRAGAVLDDLDRELRNWEAGRTFFQAGQYDKAIPCLQVVVAVNRGHAAEAQRMLEKANSSAAEAKARSQTLQETVADIRSDSRQGNFELALETCRRALQKNGAQDELRRAQEEIRDRLIGEIGATLRAEKLERAAELLALAERYFPAAAEFRSLQGQLQHQRRIAEARRLVEQKRWKEAEASLRPLVEVPELQAEARRLLQVVVDRKAVLEKNLAKARELLKTGDTEQAARLVESFRVDFPDSPEAQDMLREIRDLRQKSGNMDTEEYLRSALEEFFDTGDYRKVKFLLDEYLKRGGKRGDLALFFRAAAALSLNRLEGQESKELLEAAKKDFASLPAGFSPPRRWVSSVVMAYFDRWKNAR